MRRVKRAEEKKKVEVRKYTEKKRCRLLNKVNCVRFVTFLNFCWVEWVCFGREHHQQHDYNTMICCIDDWTEGEYVNFESLTDNNKTSDIWPVVSHSSLIGPAAQGEGTVVVVLVLVWGLLYRGRHCWTLKYICFVIAEFTIRKKWAMNLLK